jgi:hypothetical protein
MWELKNKTIISKVANKKEENIIQEMMEEYSFSEFEAKTVFKRYIDA